MVYDEKLLELLATFPASSWEGEVFRHMFAAFPPERENTSGARWNPPEVAAIYTSLSRGGALAEGDNQILMQPRRPRARRTIYTVGVRLSNVLDLQEWAGLERVGLNRSILSGVEMAVSQLIGGAAERLGHDGILVPSVRSQAVNLVIFPNRRDESTYRFEVLNAEMIDAGGTW